MRLKVPKINSNHFRSKTSDHVAIGKPRSKNSDLACDRRGPTKSGANRTYPWEKLRASTGQIGHCLLNCMLTSPWSGLGSRVSSCEGLVKLRKRGGVQKSMGNQVPWKTGVLIYLPVTSRPLISLQKGAFLSPCNFATTHLTACILNFYLP